MGELHERFNTDDILVRSVIAGLLDLLNNRIDYTQVWGSDTVETVRIPWWYDMGSSDERFMQDNYTFFGEDCFGGDRITGTFTPVPSGMITYKGSQIEANSVTNRFVQGYYLKNVGGRLTSYTSFLYSMPLTVNFDCSLKADNIVTALKAEQAVREAFYKNRTFHVLYRGMRIGCTAGFPEQTPFDNTTEYSFDNSSKNPVIKFSVSVETYQPVFDRTTEMERSRYIKEISLDVAVKSQSEGKSIRINNFDNTVVYPSGCGLLLDWTYRSENTDMLNVTVSYMEDGKNNMISLVEENAGMFIWDIPEGFGGFTQPEIVISGGIEPVEAPVVRMVPDIETGLIMDTSFVVVNPGFFIGDEGDEVPFTIEYTDSDGNPVIVSGYSFILDGNRISTDDPVHIYGDPVKYRGEVKPREISLRVAYTNDQSVYDQIDNVLIL